jgi:hypothetical protein
MNMFAARGLSEREVCRDYSDNSGAAIYLHGSTLGAPRPACMAVIDAVLKLTS